MIAPNGEHEYTAMVRQQLPLFSSVPACLYRPFASSLSTCRRFPWCRVFCLHPAPISLFLLPFLGSEEWPQSSCLPTWSWGLSSVSDSNLTRSWASRTVLWLASASLVPVSLGQPRLSTQTPVFRLTGPRCMSARLDLVSVL